MKLLPVSIVIAKARTEPKIITPATRKRMAATRPTVSFYHPLQTDEYEYFLDNEVAPIRPQLGDAGVCVYVGFVVRDVVRRL